MRNWIFDDQVLSLQICQLLHRFFMASWNDFYGSTGSILWWLSWLKLGLWWLWVIWAWHWIMLELGDISLISCTHFWYTIKVYLINYPYCTKTALKTRQDIGRSDISCIRIRALVFPSFCSTHRILFVCIMLRNWGQASKEWITKSWYEGLRKALYDHYKRYVGEFCKWHSKEGFANPSHLFL